MAAFQETLTVETENLNFIHFSYAMKYYSFDCQPFKNGKQFLALWLDLAPRPEHANPGSRPLTVCVSASQPMLLVNWTLYHIMIEFGSNYENVKHSS